MVTPLQSDGSQVGSARHMSNLYKMRANKQSYLSRISLLAAGLLAAGCRHRLMTAAMNAYQTNAIVSTEKLMKLSQPVLSLHLQSLQRRQV